MGRISCPAKLGSDSPPVKGPDKPAAPPEDVTGAGPEYVASLGAPENEGGAMAKAPKAGGAWGAMPTSPATDPVLQSGALLLGRKGCDPPGPVLQLPPGPR
jgi:hypothetical protein